MGGAGAHPALGVSSPPAARRHRADRGPPGRTSRRALRADRHEDPQPALRPPRQQLWRRPAHLRHHSDRPAAGHGRPLRPAGHRACRHGPRHDTMDLSPAGPGTNRSARKCSALASRRWACRPMPRVPPRCSNSPSSYPLPFSPGASVSTSAAPSRSNEPHPATGTPTPLGMQHRSSPVASAPSASRAGEWLRSERQRRPGVPPAWLRVRYPLGVVASRRRPRARISSRAGIALTPRMLGRSLLRHRRRRAPRQSWRFPVRFLAQRPPPEGCGEWLDQQGVVHRGRVCSP